MWEQLKRIIKPNGAIVLTASQPFTTKLISSNYKMFRYCWVWEKEAPVGFLNARRMPLKDHEDICIFYQKQPTYNPQGLIVTNTKSSRKNGKTKAGGTYGVVSDAEYFAKDGNFPRSVQKFKRVTHKQIHPTQKPVSLMEYLIKTYTNESEIVLDFTMGSGTTGVAAKNLERKFIGIESDEGYFKLATERILNS
jgi:site-specific DNA-methyltransferase (adenine-specific)